MDERERLMVRLDRAHEAMLAVLAGIEPGTAANPQWSVKEVLAHLAGWDACTRGALRAHAAGAPPPLPARDGLDAYNARSVAERQGLGYAETVEDWERTRKELKLVLAEIAAEKLDEKMVFPWGPKGTVARIVGIMAGHEEEHARELEAVK